MEDNIKEIKLPMSKQNHQREKEPSEVRRTEETLEAEKHSQEMFRHKHTLKFPSIWPALFHPHSLYMCLSPLSPPSPSLSPLLFHLLEQLLGVSCLLVHLEQLVHQVPGVLLRCNTRGTGQ